MELGRLEANVLGAVQKLGKATARQVMEEVESGHLAYTTVSTVLGRLHQKGMVNRTRVLGRGGRKYLYCLSSRDLQLSIADGAVRRLVNAFGPSIVPAIYASLEEISKKEVEDLKRQVTRARMK